MKTIYGYKALNMDMTHKGIQFKQGETFTNENGFNFFKKFKELFFYIEWNKIRVFKVSTENVLKHRTELDSEVIAKEITILEEVTRDDINYKKLMASGAKKYYDVMLESNKNISLENSENRKALVWKISDEKLAFETFKDDESWDVRANLVERLTDEELAFNTFKDDEHGAVRIAVVRKLKDENLIFNTFKNDDDSCVRETVVENLTDDNLISQFKDDEIPAVREDVVNKLSNEELSFQLFKNDKNIYVRIAVVNKLNDQQLLFDTYSDDKSKFVREELVKKLKQKELLKYFLNDEDKDVRKLANQKLKKI